MEKRARRSDHNTSAQTNDQESRATTCLFSKTNGGVRDSRKFFNLTHQRTTVDDDSNSDDEWLQDLEVFLKQTWNILAVSVLYNFNSNDEVQLKKYAKKLREEVSCMLTKEDVSYDAKVQVLNLQRPKDTDHPIIEIQVTATIVGRAKTTVVYKGYLISWRTEPSTERKIKNSIQLPLLLCRGTKNTMAAVHTILGKMFDCIIVKLPATSEDLRWILPIIISPNGGNETFKKNDEVHLEYFVPALAKIKTITINFFLKDLIKLWNSFMHDKDKIELEEVDKFHQALQKQVHGISSIQLGLCLLQRINLPALTISEIKMKVMNVEAMNTILTYLNEKALDALHLNGTLLYSAYHNNISN